MNSFYDRAICASHENLATQSKPTTVSSLLTALFSGRRVSPISALPLTKADKTFRSASGPSVPPVDSTDFMTTPTLPGQDSFQSITKIVQEKVDSSLVEGDEIVSTRYPRT